MNMLLLDLHLEIHSFSMGQSVSFWLLVVSGWVSALGDLMRFVDLKKCVSSAALHHTPLSFPPALHHHHETAADKSSQKSQCG